MSLDEIKVTLDIGKTAVAVWDTKMTIQEPYELGIDIVARRKDTLEQWILEAL